MIAGQTEIHELRGDDPQTSQGGRFLILFRGGLMGFDITIDLPLPFDLGATICPNWLKA